MTFKPRFLYDEGNQNDGGGNPDGGTPAAVEAPPQILSVDELKGYGFDSPEALKTFLAQKKESEIPESEKIAKANEEKANFLKFAAENKDTTGNPLLKVEDYQQYETIKSKPDDVLVFENYLSEFKTDHPEITDPTELESAAKEDFDYEYKRKAGMSEAEKKKGEAKLARDAKDLRNPIETKVASIQSQFKEQNSYKEALPKFNTFIDGLITKSTPDKLAIVKVKNGDTEIPIEIELTKEDREAMAKTFKTPKSFKDFIGSKPEEVQAKLESKMNGWLIKNKAVAIAQKALEDGIGIGIAKGSDIGAENPFPLRNNASNVINTTSETLEASNARLSNVRKKYIAR